MKFQPSKIIAGLKRNALHFGLVLAYTGFVSWKVRGFWNVVAAWLIFLVIEGILALVKKRLP